MRRCCATCGRPFFGLSLAEVDALDALRLSPRQRALLDCMVETFPRPASKTSLLEEAWELLGEAIPISRNRIAMHMVALRRLVAGCGFRILCGERGYRLVRVAETNEESVKAAPKLNHAVPMVAA